MLDSSRTAPTEETPHVDLELSHCFITVRDLDEALAFYRDVLGLQVRTDAAIGPMRWLTVGPEGQPDVQVSLETPEGRPGDVGALAEVVAAGSLTGAIFRTADCDAAFAELLDAHAPVVQEPKDQPYGVRDCAVRDPSGNMLRFAQSLEAGTA